MRIRLSLLFFVFLSAVTGFADASITNIAVRQRWPWSNKVDIDYVYMGACTTSITFTATWDGQPTPVNIVPIHGAETFDVSPGQHRYVWDPADSGVDKQHLSNFKVEATPCVDPRTYLVVDLKNGGHDFMAAPPDGGWTSAYKSEKMVFRRIPAGTYQLGYPHTNFYAAAMTDENGTTRPIAQGGAVRTVTLSSDFYFQVFATTSGQYQYINAGFSNNDTNPAYFLGQYADLRGSALDDDVTAVNWPATGHSVNSSSLVGKLRVLAGNGLLADLPTDAQWEIAMRAGTATFFPNGEPDEYTYEKWDVLAKELFWNNASKLGNGDPIPLDANPTSKEVGLKACNRFGIYDFMIRQDPVLDWANDKEALNSINKPNLDFPEGGVDPEGPVSSIHNVRVLRGGSALGPTWCMYNYALTTRAAYDVDTDPGMANGLRFAIHLKPFMEE